MFNFLKKIYWQIFKTHQWYILVKKKNSKKWIRLEQPKNVSRADSFIVYNNNKYFIFYEEFDIQERHGYLAVGELDIENKKLRNEKIILKEKYHLSFPNVFMYQNEYYMIPESHANGTVDLYRFIDFPYKVKKINTLLNDINAADSVVCFKDGVCYLFTNIYTNAQCLHAENLSIFQSSDLLNVDFKPVHRNPVETDKQFARMGGQFIQNIDGLFRVSQDCHRRYGYKINLMKVVKLTSFEYEEELFIMMNPPKGYIAFHTYNIANNYEVGDGKIIVKNLKIISKNIFELLVSISNKIRRKNVK